MRFTQSSDGVAGMMIVLAKINETINWRMNEFQGFNSVYFLLNLNFHVEMSPLLEAFPPRQKQPYWKRYRNTVSTTSFDIDTWTVKI